jgi:hypothetical protein
MIAITTSKSTSVKAGTRFDSAIALEMKFQFQQVRGEEMSLR